MHWFYDWTNQRTNTICCFSVILFIRLFISLHFYSIPFQDGSQFVRLENKHGKPNLKASWNKPYMACAFQYKKRKRKKKNKISAFSNIWLSLILLVYVVNQITGVVMIWLWLSLNNIPEHSKIRNFSGIKFCNSMENKIWFF